MRRSSLDAVTTFLLVLATAALMLLAAMKGVERGKRDFKDVFLGGSSDCAPW